MEELVPPQNLEAEVAVLGSMLTEEEAIARAIELLDEGCFYHDSHQKIFSAITRLYNDHRVVDLLILTDELKKKKLLDEVGGEGYLAKIAASVPTAANIEHYSRIVKEKAVLRSLIDSATRIAESAHAGEGSADDVLDEAERLIFEITSRRIKGGSFSLKEIIKDSLETIDALYQRKEHITGVPTGFREFDQRTAGLQRSDFIVIAGRPSMGKSALALSIAEHVGAAEKIPVAIFSLEMSKEQLVQRILCSHARVDAHKLRTGFLSKEDWPRLTNAAGKLSESPIYIDDTPALSALELRAKARRLKSRHQIGLIIVDYLQLMRGPAAAENRQQQISEISRSLKALARELSVPVIAVSQLSRAVESRTDHRPQLFDLRESGAIEQDADVVVLLLREDYYRPTKDNEGIAELNIAKQRNGPVGTIRLAFIKEFVRFENLAREESFAPAEF